MKMTGSQIVLEVLKEHGVDTVFGYPGGTALNLYDELYKQSNHIKHILTAHEQGAAHAADGYARSTGKIGVVMATSGPGATNLVTGIATAFMDSIPLLAITVNVPDSLIGRDAFQEISITGVTMPITKHNFFINKIEDLVPCLKSAFEIAQSNRKGPVLVDITKDVTAAEMDYVPQVPNPLRQQPTFKAEDVAAIVDMINNAEKPLLYVGGGAAMSEAFEEVRCLAEKADIPVAHTLMASGIIDSEDPHSLGLVGMHGSVASNRAVDQADLVIALGARFSDRVALNPKKWATKAKIVQVDIDRSEVNKNVVVDHACIADVKEFLTKALPYINEAKHEEWMQRVSSWKIKERTAALVDCPLHPKEIVDIVCELSDKETIYVTDVGQHQMWAAQYVKHNKLKKFITSGGLGTMGFGYGAAIGSQVGNPDCRVVHFTGDGSFHMNMNEACTAVSQNLPIITVIMDNRVLGMVYQWQTAFYDKRYSNTTPERKSDFVKLAEGFGAKGFRATTPEEFREAYKMALKESGPVWIDCIISREERVLPMIPAAKTVADMIID